MRWSDKAWDAMKRAAYAAWRDGLTEIELHWMVQKAWEPLRQRDLDYVLQRALDDACSHQRQQRECSASLQADPQPQEASHAEEVGGD